MIDLEDIKYNSDGLMETQHYKIVIAWSEDLKTVCYHAQNKQTGVLEIPFRTSSDSKAVLSDLEGYHEETQEADSVVSLKGVH